jgi:hypothetical protein
MNHVYDLLAVNITEWHKESIQSPSRAADRITESLYGTETVWSHDKLQGITDDGVNTMARLWRQWRHSSCGERKHFLEICSLLEKSCKNTNKTALQPQHSRCVCHLLPVMIIRYHQHNLGSEAATSGKCTGLKMDAWGAAKHVSPKAGQDSPSEAPNTYCDRRKHYKINIKLIRIKELH